VSIGLAGSAFVFDVARHTDLALAPIDLNRGDERDLARGIDVGEAPQLVERRRPGRHQAVVARHC
jgi:hypothetical protein